MILSGMASDGKLSFASCCGKPIIRNYDFEGFKHKRLIDIQSATVEIVSCSTLTAELKEVGEKDMKSWVSSA